MKVHVLDIFNDWLYLLLSQSEPTADMDDEELDFFDDAVFEHEFEEELTHEDPAAQKQGSEDEFEDDAALENEFDEDLDAFMSQMWATKVWRDFSHHLNN